jgi:hypothetical protein
MAAETGLSAYELWDVPSLEAARILAYLEFRTPGSGAVAQAATKHWILANAMLYKEDNRVSYNIILIRTLRIE